MRNILFLFSFVFLGFFFASRASAQQPSWNVYVDSISQGALAEQPAVIDPQGNVWVIHWDDSLSIARFDGAHWTHYGPAEGVPRGYTHAIITDRNGNIWMSADSGIAEFQNGSWHSYAIQDKLTGTRTYGAIAADSMGNIWVATFAKIVISQIPGGTYDSTWNECYRFDGNSWKSFTPPYIFNWSGFNTMAFASDGTLWAAGPEQIDSAFKVFNYGLWRFDGTTWQSFNIEQGTGFTSQSIGSTGAMTLVEGTALQPDRNGGVWVTLGYDSPSSQDAVYFFNGTAWDTTGFSGRRYSNMWLAPNGDKYFRSNTRNRYGYTTDTGALVIERSNGNLDSIPMAEIPFFPFASIQFAQDGTPWLSSPWGDGNSSLGVGLETFAAPSSVTHTNSSNTLQCSVYPNPMLADVAHLSLSGAESGVYQITLTNTLAIVLKSASVNASGTPTCDLSTSDLASGAYLITIANGAERVTIPVVKE